MDWDRNDYRNEGKTCISIDCSLCGDNHRIWVEDNDYEAWNNGKLCQDAFPYLDASQRELLVSLICGPCFNLLFEADSV